MVGRQKGERAVLPNKADFRRSLKFEVASVKLGKSKVRTSNFTLYTSLPAEGRSCETKPISAGLVQTRVTVWVGGSGKAEGFAQVLPMADKQDHRQAPKTALAAATRSLLPEKTVS